MELEMTQPEMNVFTLWKVKYTYRYAMRLENMKGNEREEERVLTEN